MITCTVRVIISAFIFSCNKSPVQAAQELTGALKKEKRGTATMSKFQRRSSFWDDYKLYIWRGVIGCLVSVIGCLVIFAVTGLLFKGDGEKDTAPALEVLGDVYVCSGCGKEYINQFPYISPWEGYPTGFDSTIEVMNNGKRSYNGSIELVNIGQETSDNDSIDGATPVSMYQYVTGNLSSRDDVDFYRFTVDVPGSVICAVLFGGVSEECTHWWDGVIYGTDGATVLLTASAPIESGRGAPISIYDLQPGTYYLKISFASDENTFVNGYSDSDYSIYFFPACIEHTDVTTALIEAPTCSQTGEMVTQCNTCDLTVSTETLEPLDHIWSKWKPVKESFFSSIYGSYSRICALCGEEETDTLLFHFLEGNPKTDLDAVTATETGTELETASCVSEGFAKTVCSVCGNVEVERKEATGHTYGEWEISHVSTCSVEGERSRTCTVCGHVETETLDCIPHAYDEAVYISGSILDAPIVSQEICAECGYVNTVESGWFWWIRPAIIILAAAGISAFLIGAKNSLLTPEKKVIKSIFVSGAVEGLIITILTMVMSFRVDKGDNPFLFLLVLPMCLVVIVVTTILLCKITGTDVNNRIIFTIVVRFVISLGASVIIFSCFGGSNEDCGVHWTCLR